MIRFCVPLVLTLIFGPRMDQEYFHKPIGHLDIAIDTPSSTRHPDAEPGRIAALSPRILTLGGC